MALTASISFNITPLPENDVWFANAQAWNNYWRDVSGDVIINAIANDLYIPLTYDEGSGPVILELGGIQYVIITKPMFDSLLSKVENLDASYQVLRTDLRDAGLLENAQ
jgi:hypothetical protein